MPPDAPVQTICGTACAVRMHPAPRITTADIAGSAEAKRLVNERCGRFKVRSAATLYLPTVYRDPANGFDICDVRGKVCF